MVAKIISGKGIKGALNYNEQKVAEGKAVLLYSARFPENLSFEAKLKRFSLLTEQNQRTKTNAVHVSLNFDPSEKIGEERLREIAGEYMGRIGFGEQPYLLYQHLDAAHPHLHIVTTNIKDGGERISLHNIGRNQSEVARKEIEKLFGLVPAEGREQAQEQALKPIAETVVYGKSQIKAAISNAVRAVVRDYKFTSLAELNAVLQGYNVTAYRGEEGSIMYEKKGLTYSVLNDKGNRIGVPIKASSIYTKPTLSNLEKKFATNKEERQPYRERLKGIIDKTLALPIPDREALQKTLEAQGISVVFRENENMVYGVTFVDNKAKTVFNGSDLGKDYSAARIMQRIGTSGLQEQKEKKYNRDFADRVLKETDYTKRIAGALAFMYSKGMRIKTEDGESYRMGHCSTKENSFIPASDNMAAYFEVNGITAYICNGLNDAAGQEQHFRSGFDFGLYLQEYIKSLIATDPTIAAAPKQDLDKKKRRRKPNW